MRCTRIEEFTNASQYEKFSIEHVSSVYKKKLSIKNFVALVKRREFVSKTLECSPTGVNGAGIRTFIRLRTVSGCVCEGRQSFIRHSAARPKSRQLYRLPAFLCLSRQGVLRIFLASYLMRRRMPSVGNFYTRTRAPQLQFYNSARLVYIRMKKLQINVSSFYRKYRLV